MSIATKKNLLQRLFYLYSILVNGGNNVDYLTRLLDYNNLLGGQNIQHQVYNPYLTAYQWQQ